MKARVYKIFAWVFTMVGFIIFMTQYYTHIDGQILDALSSPGTLGIILVPFLPAIFLSLKAAKEEKEFYKMIRPDTAEKKKKKK